MADSHKTSEHNGYTNGYSNGSTNGGSTKSTGIKVIVVGAGQIPLSQTCPNASDNYQASAV